MKLRNLIITTAALMITGCMNTKPLPPATISTPTSSEKAILIQLVRSSLKDSDSAKFGDAVIIDYGKAACVEVNAKNSYGGYTGYQQAMLANVQGAGWQVLKIQGVSRDICINSLHSIMSK